MIAGKTRYIVTVTINPRTYEYTFTESEYEQARACVDYFKGQAGVLQVLFTDEEGASSIEYESMGF